MGKKAEKKQKQDDLKKELELDEHKIDLDELCKRTGTDAEKGLTEEQAEKCHKRWKLCFFVFLTCAVRQSQD